MVFVYVFTGAEEQTPIEYDLTFDPSATYQDVVTTIISRGHKSGTLYDIDWRPLNYDDKIEAFETPGVSLELNYYISTQPEETIYIRTLKGEIVKISYPQDGTIQDVYNQVLSNGFGRNVRLALEDEDAPPNMGTRIVFILSHNVRREIPTLLYGKYYDHDVKLSNLNLNPNMVFHLVKYHIGFSGIGCG